MLNTSVLAKRKVHKSKGAYVIPKNDLMKMADKVEKYYKGGKTKKLASFTELID